jgi:hypothetical protein
MDGRIHRTGPLMGRRSLRLRLFGIRLVDSGKSRQSWQGYPASG